MDRLKKLIILKMQLKTMLHSHFLLMKTSLMKPITAKTALSDCWWICKFSRRQSDNMVQNFKCTILRLEIPPLGIYFMDILVKIHQKVG